MTIKLPPLPVPDALLHHDDGYFTTKRRETRHGDVFRTLVYTAETVERLRLEAIEAIERKDLIRFCPECGSLGEVPFSARDCCPDGSHAAHMPRKTAESCARLFRDLLASAPAQQPLTDEQIATACAKVKCVHPDAMTTRDIARAIEAYKQQQQGEAVPTPTPPSLYADQHRFGPYTDDDDTSNLMGG